MVAIHATLCRGGVCFRIGTQCRSMYYIAENARADNQQMIGVQRQIYGHFGYEPLVLLRYHEIQTKMYKTPFISSVHAQVVNKGSTWLTRPRCHVHSFRRRRNALSPVADYGALRLRWTCWKGSGWRNPLGANGWCFPLTRAVPGLR